LVELLNDRRSRMPLQFQLTRKVGGSWLVLVCFAERNSAAVQGAVDASQCRRRSNLRNEAHDLLVASHRDLYADHSVRRSGQYFQSCRKCWHFSRPGRAVLCSKSPALQENGDQFAEFREWHKDDVLRRIRKINPSPVRRNRNLDF
jgi:hypothetical protein